MTDDASAREPVTVSLEGELDLSRVRDIQYEILSAPTTKGGTVLLDMSRVTFLDSAGIHAMIGVRRTLTERGIQLRVVNPSPLVRRVLEIAGVFDDFGPSPV